MTNHPAVTVEHGSQTITTNTASEADLRAELTGDQPPVAAPADGEAAPAPAVAGEAAPAAARARDAATGRFTRAEGTPPADLPDAAAESPADPTEAAHTPPQRRRDDSLPRHDKIARMNQALAKAAEAERRAAALEHELARLRPLQPQAPGGAPPMPSAGAPADGEPQFEQFADQPDPYTAYVQAWARWDNRRQITETIAQYEQASLAKYREHQFTQNLASGRTAYADFDQVLTQADTLGLQVSAVMREAIADSPRAADLVYFLATHPEECTQLALETEHTPPAAATVMRRLLESQLGPRAVSPSGNGAAAKAPVSLAKPPISPVGSSHVGTDDPPGESASAAEHARYWNRRLKVPGTQPR